jgi:hypothetical protein
MVEGESIMAKNKLNKTLAVREYLEAHPEAGRSEIVQAMAKQRIKLTPSHAANIKSKIMRTQAALPEKQATPSAETVASAETPAKPANAVTLEQIKLVGQMVKTIAHAKIAVEHVSIIIVLHLARPPANMKRPGERVSR